MTDIMTTFPRFNGTFKYGPADQMLRVRETLPSHFGNIENANITQPQDSAKPEIDDTEEVYGDAATFDDVSGIAEEVQLSEYDAGAVYNKCPMLQNFLIGLEFGRDATKTLPDSLFELLEAQVKIKLDTLQKESISYALTGRDTLIADEQGTGKTYTALATARLAFSDALLIVCPHSMKYTWASACETFGYTVRVVDSKTLSRAFSRGHSNYSPGTVTIINYDILPKLLSYLKAGRNLVLPYDFTIIFDEAHYLKNSMSKRTQAVFDECFRNAKMRLFLTGTPMDKPYDLWGFISQFRIPRNLPGSGFNMNEMEFVKEYCGGRKVQETRRKADGTEYKTPWAWTKKEASNTDRLHKLLKRFCMVRHLAPEWNADQTPMQHSYIILPREPESGQPEDVTTAVNEVGKSNYNLSIALRNVLAEEMRSRGHGKHIWNYKQADDLLVTTLDAVLNNAHGRGILPPFEQISAYRRALGKYKTPLAIRWIEEFMETHPDRKLVVFTYHTEVADALTTAPTLAAYKPVAITGAQSAEQKFNNAQAFQTDSTCRIIVGNTAAASVGITLTAAQDTLHVEPDWSARVMRQANKRTDRRGQTKACRAHYLVVADSMDIGMTRRVVKKSLMADAVIDGQEIPDHDKEDVGDDTASADYVGLLGLLMAGDK